MSDYLANLRRNLLQRRIRGRVFITGTGRAGTSFLIQLLTDLGLDTGFATETNEVPDDRHAPVYFETARAGFERDLFDRKNPFIVKSPLLCDEVDSVLEAGIAIGHLIVPIRDLAEAAESRRHVQMLTTGKANGLSVAGGLWGTNQGKEQEAILAEKLARLIVAGVRHDIPMTFLNFPRFARDPDYTFEKLRFLLPMMRRRTFRRKFDVRVRPEFIHEFRDNTKLISGSKQQPKPSLGD